MSKEQGLNYTHAMMLVVIGLSIVAISGIYVTLDDQRMMFGNTEKRLNIIYPERSKFGFNQFDLTVNFTYQTFKGLTPKFFHEYTLTYEQVSKLGSSYAVVIKFLVESALVTFVEMDIVGFYSDVANATAKSSPIYYDALNTPLQDVYVFIYNLPWV